MVMLSGYNTNVPYGDAVFHVQTEDGGRRNPVITSLLYYQGAILLSRKMRYDHLLHEKDIEEKVSELMKIQHKQVLSEMMNGKVREVEEIVGRSAHAAPQKEEETVDISDTLIDYIITR